MDSRPTPPPDDAPEAATPDAGTVRVPDDPRVPRPEDADPTTSKELGGAAPAVGPGGPAASGRRPGSS